MFERCQSLKKIDLSGLDARYVTDMYGMFSNCYDLTEVNLSGLNTENVTNMGDMFEKCRELTKVNLSGINTKMWTVLLACLVSVVISRNLILAVSIRVVRENGSNVCRMFYA